MDPNKKNKLQAFANRLLMRDAAAGERMESIGGGPVRVAVFDDRDQETVNRVVAMAPMNDEQVSRLEAIILPDLRPVFDIRNNTFIDLPQTWSGLNSNRQKLEDAIRAIGRVEIINHPRVPYGGTGFLVGRGLLMTNRHVAALFTDGLGRRNLKMTFNSQVDLRQEIDGEGSVLLTVKETLMIHPYWDCALLRVEGMPDDVKPLTLARDSSGFSGNLVAVIGYPALDPRNNVDVQRRVFNNTFEKKRLQPGYLTGMQQIVSYTNTVEAVTHDASTLGGNSGSAIVDVLTGTVAALHFAGIYLEANYAVPAWELSRDPKMVDLGINFATASSTAPSVTAPWLSSWDVLEKIPPPKVTPPAPVTTTQVAATVDDECTWTIPIQVTIRVGTPSRQKAAITAQQVSAPTSPLDEFRAARKRITEDPASYYDETKDSVAINSYYGAITPCASPSALYDSLSKLLKQTHTNQPKYKPVVHLYPVVDLHPDGELISIYSEAAMNPEEVIATELAMEEAVEAARASGAQESVIEALEAIAQNSAEHVVPQSWFKEREPMRGDLHHLFACDRNCNSFRGNIPYFQFAEEAVKEDCGRRESLRFEPKGGKGPVARAVLYFLMRYPGEINNTANEYTPDRITTLLKWHEQFPVDLYEKHRNREIFLKQGNRNPLIDHPEWASRIDFNIGLG